MNDVRRGIQKSFALTFLGQRPKRVKQAMNGAGNQLQGSSGKW